MEALNSSKPYRYEEAKRLLKDILEDFQILSGDQVTRHGRPWQPIAATAAMNLYCLAVRMEAARTGYVAEHPVVFPSPDDL